MKIPNKTKNMRKAFACRKRKLCPNCGKTGSHFVPPLLGESGFFICHMFISDF